MLWSPLPGMGLIRVSRMLTGGRAKPVYWGKWGGCLRSTYRKATFLDQLAGKLISLFTRPDARKSSSWLLDRLFKARY